MGGVCSRRHGKISEPCNRLQKFAHPRWLLLQYLQGSSAVEAHWKSVLWPQQSLFVGDPLAAPFACRRPADKTGCESDLAIVRIRATPHDDRAPT